MPRSGLRYRIGRCAVCRRTARRAFSATQRWRFCRVLQRSIRAVCMPARRLLLFCRLPEGPSGINPARAVAISRGRDGPKAFVLVPARFGAVVSTSAARAIGVHIFSFSTGSHKSHGLSRIGRLTKNRLGQIRGFIFRNNIVIISVIVNNNNVAILVTKQSRLIRKHEVIAMTSVELFLLLTLAVSVVGSLIFCWLHYRYMAKLKANALGHTTQSAFPLVRANRTI